MPIYPYMKNGKEHWYYAFEVKDSNGKRKTIKKRGFDGKTKARNAEAEARVAWEKGTYIDPSKMLYSEYVTNWLANKQDVSPETRETNEGHLRNHIIPVLGHIPLQKINVQHLEEFIKKLNEKSIAAGTVKKIFNLVQTSFKSAERKELILKNPFNLLGKEDKPKVTRRKFDYWTTEEVKQFFSVLEHRQKIMFVLAIYTGMRRGEILGLRWKDIDFNNNQLRITQTLKPRNRIKEDGGKTENASRSITVSPFVMSELKKHRPLIAKEKLKAEKYHDNDLVVCQENGKPVSLGNFTKFWNRIIEKTGMRRIKFHDLRHTCASLLLSAGVHPKVVQELLGHASIKITLDNYSHMMPNMQEDAVKALDKLLN
ncbi:tyrosine-type recombinase/integrase [Bacillus sp. JJ1533]|uniref:tyrosine-type recombinase/integrase n=1 Tax=Bacillus sp. JJ1533 TaxID=3122959 RepID=UPI002FFF223D